MKEEIICECVRVRERDRKDRQTEKEKEEMTRENEYMNIERRVTKRGREKRTERENR